MYKLRAKKEELQNAMINEGLTQTKLAELSNVSHPQTHNICNGGNTTPKTAKAICNVFGMAVMDLFERVK